MYDFVEQRDRAILSLFGRRKGDLTETTKRVVVALGGNAIQKPEQVGTIEEQFISSGEACAELVKIVQAGHELVVTHGNGPQVGRILRRVELASKEVYPLPLDVCVADSQGGMGFMLQEQLNNEAIKVGEEIQAATVITRCVVDKEDPAFKKPTKPIGSFMTEAEALERKNQDGWDVMEDAGRGWRRVVASPWPKRILERNIIKRLVGGGFIVIACGGGGIPVVQRENGRYYGVEAVIDKDIASALLALELNADILIILTGVDRVKVNYRKPDEKSIDRMTSDEAKQYLAEGQFPPGSMGPKIQAAIYYLESGGSEVLITDFPKLIPAMRGETGTRIIGSVTSNAFFGRKVYNKGKSVTSATAVVLKQDVGI